MHRSPVRRSVRIGLLVLALAAIGEAGHRWFGATGLQAGHHLFHLAYGIGAIVAFAASAARDVRRNGLPRFSWALRPELDVPSGIRSEASGG